MLRVHWFMIERGLKIHTEWGVFFKELQMEGGLASPTRGNNCAVLQTHEGLPVVLRATYQDNQVALIDTEGSF